MPLSQSTVYKAALNVWQRRLNMHTFFKLADAAPLMCSLNSSRLLTIYRWNGATKWDFDFSSSSCHMASHKATTETGLERRYTLTTLNLQCSRDRDILTHAVHVWRRLSASAHFMHNPCGTEWLTNKRLNYGQCEVLWATQRLAILRIALPFFPHKIIFCLLFVFEKGKQKKRGCIAKLELLTSLENSAEGAFYLASGVWMRFESDDLMLLNQEG